MRKDAGLVAFFEMYAWFMVTTGLHQSERMASLLTPKQVKNDEDIADAIETWEREEAELKRIDPTAGLGESWRTTAIKNFLPQMLKEHIHMK